jgi:hypothetical protein
LEIALTRNKAELERLEGVIATNLNAFYEVGRALMEIRDNNYYSDVLGYETFEAYCRDRWDFGKAYAYRLIGAATVVNNVSPKGDKIPATETQCRPLTKLDPEQQVKAWEMAVETAPDGKVTANHVARIVKGMVTDEHEKKVHKIKTSIDETRVHPDFEKAYRDFYREVQKSKLEEWKDTSKEEALKLVGYIIDLINIQ